MSLKTKMTLGVSLMVAVLLSVAAVLAVGYLEKQLKGMICAQQLTMVSAIADQLDDKLHTAQNELDNVARTLAAATAGDPASAARFLAGHPDTLAMFDSGVYIYSPAGRIIAESPVPAPLSRHDFSSEDSHARLLHAQLPFAFSAEVPGRDPVMMFTSRVRDGRGETVAVLAGAFDLSNDNFLGKLRSVRLGTHGYLYLFDSSRRLLVHPDRQRMLQRDVPPGANLLFDKAVAGFEGAGETRNSHGQPLISSFKRLRSTGWILAGNLPMAEAYAPVYRAQRYAAMALTVAMALSVLLVWAFIQRLAAPLLLMTEEVKALVGKKDMGSRIAAHPGDEIGVLAEAFNAVLSELDTQKGELRQQLTFTRALLDTIPIPLFYKDVDGVFLGCNKAFESYIGLSVQELVGKTVFDFQPRDLAAIYHKADQEILKGRTVQVYESSVLYADGRLHDIIFHKGVYLSADGTPMGIVGAMLDISERKRSEEAHEKTRRQMQLILDAAGEGIYGVDLEGRVTFINPAGAKMSGWTAEELLGAHQHSILHHSRPDGTPYPVAECPIYAAFKDGIPRHVSDEVFWRKDGTSFPVEYVSNPLIEEGVLVGAVVIFKDTTERKQAEEQLLKFSAAIMQSPVSVMITDTAGNIEFVNPRFCQLTGYAAEEVLGRNPRLFQSGQTSSEVYTHLWHTIRSGQVWTGDIYNRTRSGDFFWERATIFPIRNQGGVITSYMALKEDISEQKRLEAQLRHAQKMEAVGQLAGGVAHDFNNILTVIIGFGELLQQALPMGDPKRKQMDQILSAAQRAVHLTTSLLAFSRKQIMHLVPTDLNALAKKHAKFLERIIGEDVALQTDFGNEPLMVLADGGQIEQVLMNLATNARDAMPGGGTLHIVSETVHLDREFYRQHGFGPPGNYALLTVSDMGMGMDEETQKKIFEPFFTTKELGRGTGLGLSIVYGIVKQHGGYINVSSNPGVGTTFSIYLPLIAMTQEKEQVSAPPLPEGGPETILLAEDDAAVRELIASVLAQFGYRVVVAHDGQEAVELFGRHRGEIDMAIFDVIMPRMSGKEACDELRKLDPALKVLLLSGYTADVIENRGILVEGVDLLMKPVQPVELARKVRAMLDG